MLKTTSTAVANIKLRLVDLVPLVMLAIGLGATALVLTAGSTTQALLITAIATPVIITLTLLYVKHK